jgi:hypothetical protein
MALNGQFRHPRRRKRTLFPQLAAQGQKLAQINVIAGRIEYRDGSDIYAQHTTADPIERCHMISRNITFVSAIVGAAALLATPALAAKVSKKKSAAPKAHVSSTHRSPDGVYAWDGRYLGADPDPNIRFQLMRDQNQPPD